MGKMRTEVKENLCEMEKIRLRNIAERKKMFQDLNLDSLKKKFLAHSEYKKAQRAAKKLKIMKYHFILGHDLHILEFQQ